jgi:hypothetical protein
MLDLYIDAHGLTVQGRVYLKFLPKSLGGVKAFRKNCQGGGGPPVLGFIAFLLTSFSKRCCPPMGASMDLCIDAHWLKIQRRGYLKCIYGFVEVIKLKLNE